MLILAPATSANLGPGFDCLGICWSLYNEITFSLAEKTTVSGCDSRYCNEQNLALLAFRRTEEICGKESASVALSFGKTDIPVSRGLGSSAALIASGVLAASSLHHLNLQKEAMLGIATEIEGHPDNLAPVFYGGLCCTLMDENLPVTRNFALSPSLAFTAVIPNFELSTEKARSVLPEKYPRSDAVYNISHALLTMKALENGDLPLLNRAMLDKIHQPYRFPLISGIERVRDICRGYGAAMCISGAGPTLLCVCDQAIQEKLMAELSSAFPNWLVSSLQPDREGIKVQ